MVCLLIGAHHDDIELGCGGSVIRHLERGDEVYYAVLHSDEFRTGDPAIRLEEQRAAINLLPGAVTLWTYREETAASQIIADLDKIKADRLYIPWKRDTHMAHCWASAIGESVSRRGADFLYYNSGSAMGFLPEIFVEIDWLKKKALLECFNSQEGHMRISESNIESFICGRLSWKVSSREGSPSFPP